MLDSPPLVFIVDDDVSVRESLEFLIRQQRWQPEVFASADEFLSRPQPFVPSCLILDLSLPGLSGLDLQERIANGALRRYSAGSSCLRVETEPWCSASSRYHPSDIGKTTS